MQPRKTPDVARSHQADLGHCFKLVGKPPTRLPSRCPAKRQSIGSCEGAWKPAEMSSQSTDTVSAYSSVPEILQAKGRRLRVNYVRRDDDYEVCCWEGLPDTRKLFVEHVIEHRPLVYAI